jgi:hypothetical protein
MHFLLAPPIARKTFLSTLPSQPASKYDAIQLNTFAAVDLTSFRFLRSLNASLQKASVLTLLSSILKTRPCTATVPRCPSPVLLSLSVYV